MSWQSRINEWKKISVKTRQTQKQKYFHHFYWVLRLHTKCTMNCFFNLSLMNSGAKLRKKIILPMCEYTSSWPKNCIHIFFSVQKDGVFVIKRILIFFSLYHTNVHVCVVYCRKKNWETRHTGEKFIYVIFFISVCIV